MRLIWQDPAKVTCSQKSVAWWGVLSNIYKTRCFSFENMTFLQTSVASWGSLYWFLQNNYLFLEVVLYQKSVASWGLYTEFSESDFFSNKFRLMGFYQEHVIHIGILHKYCFMIRIDHLACNNTFNSYAFVKCFCLQL